jgi:serine/threonine protein kinase
MDESQNSSGAWLSPQIKQDYNVIRLLGKGGMGEVYLAEQLRVGRRPVALKVLSRSCCENPDLKRRFENEAASAGRIHHPNVVMIYECRATDDGQLYVAMQYVEGMDLGQAIEERGALPLADIFEIARQAAAGLGAAHKLGIVHRDVKPANIMLTRDDDGKLVVKLLDFGIARLSEPDSTGAQTKTGVVMGTPHYMSPEQALGKTGDKIDNRSDIYSLAMAVYQMLTGKVAFESDSWMQVIYKHINEPPQPPSQLRPELANIGGIDRVILKGLEKDREKRYQTVTEFVSDLEAACARLKSDGRDQVPTAIYPRSVSPEQASASPPTKLQRPEPASTELIADTTAAVSPGHTTPSPAGGRPAETAVVVLDGLEAGSSVAYGVGRHTSVGVDGRATVPLVPGTHEIEVTDSSGGRQKRLVTIMPQDVGTFKRIPMTLPSRPAAPAGSVYAGAAQPKSTRSSRGKRIAAVVSGILLLGLAAAAYVVTRGPGPAPQQIERKGAIEPSGPQARRGGDEAKRENARPGEGAAWRGERNPHEPPGVVPPPRVTTGNEATEGGTCLGVTVTRGGKALEGCFLTLTEQQSGKTYEARTGPKGVHEFCGLIPGRQVAIRVLGPAGRQIADRTLVLRAGSNSVEFQG